MELGEELRQMAERHEEELGPVLWASEADRWEELVFCVIHAFVGDPLPCRRLAENLRDLQLIEPSTLAAQASTAPAHAVIRHFLARHGTGQDEIDRLIEALSCMSSAVMSGYQGKIQRYLRVKANAIRDDLAAVLAEPRTPSDELRRGVTHWLQNAAGLPISVEDESVQQFCAARGITREQLEGAADAIDFNLALVDDLIRLEKS